MHLQKQGPAEGLPRRGRQPPAAFQPTALPPSARGDGGNPNLPRVWESGRRVRAQHRLPCLDLFAIFFF